MKNLGHISLQRNVKVIKVDEDGGAFLVHDGRKWLKVIASFGGDWDHVSVSLPNRLPSWGDMEYIKRFFFNEDEVAYQLHVPPKDHISIHPYCLHLWRPQKQDIPLPPTIMV